MSISVGVNIDSETKFNSAVLSCSSRTIGIEGDRNSTYLFFSDREDLGRVHAEIEKLLLEWEKEEVIDE